MDQTDYWSWLCFFRVSEQNIAFVTGMWGPSKPETEMGCVDAPAIASDT